MMFPIQSRAGVRTLHLMTVAWTHTVDITLSPATFHDSLCQRIERTIRLLGVFVFAS
jgi:hypothetical protein